MNTIPKTTLLSASVMMMQAAAAKPLATLRVWDAFTQLQAHLDREKRFNRRVKMNFALRTIMTKIDRFMRLSFSSKVG